MGEVFASLNCLSQSAGIEVIEGCTNENLVGALFGWNLITTPIVLMLAASVAGYIFGAVLDRFDDNWLGKKFS